MNINPNDMEILQQIAKKTDNDLVLFFIIASVVLVVFMLPLYGMLIKDKRDKHKAESEKLDKYIQREGQIMEVIKENSQVISGLKVTLDSLGMSTLQSFDRIHTRIDHVCNGLEKILLIVDNIPTSSNFSGFQNHNQ